MVVKAIEAAETLTKEGVEVEVIDPRTIVPLDRKTILDSVKKTGRLVVVDEAQAFCGFSAEVAAIVSEQALEFLNAPIQRVCALHTPHPFNGVLEAAMLPSVDGIVEAVRKAIRG
jgi:pyruvate dehydrogenase E1 component beta subunit